jgi:inorganic pyrophosphatase
MHPWHDTYVDDAVIATGFPVIVEIPKGSTNKYELDKETGLLRLDRVLYSAVYYPADYGFIPRTYCDDGDPLDALCWAGAGLSADHRPGAVGVMRMRDDKGVDDKIVAVSVRDPLLRGLHRQEPALDTSCGRCSGFSRTTRCSSTRRS